MFKQQEFDLIKKIQADMQNFDGEYTLDVLFKWMRVLFIPQTKWLKKLPTQKIDLENWGISHYKIWICKANYKYGTPYRTVQDDFSVRNVARHLHVSVKHYWVTYSPASDTEKIDKMNFFKKKDSRINFQLEVSPENFRVFLLKFCETISPELSN